MSESGKAPMAEFCYATVLSEIVADGVRLLTLNRPDSLNAMNAQLISDLAKAVKDANADSETRVIVLTGAGRAFCAGDDRKAHRHPEDEQEARAVVNAIQRVTEEMVFGAKPIVGAINGWAVGGGFEWAINCDFPLYAESAKAFFPEVSLNLFVTGGVTALLPSIVGLQKAKEMLFFAEHYNARELADLGLAWKVVDDSRLLHEALDVAKKLAALPPLSVQSMKRVIHLAGPASIKNAMALETEATVIGFLDPETTRRLSAF